MILHQLDGASSRWCNELNLHPRLSLFRHGLPLGDGVFWYCLMAAFAILDGSDGRWTALYMAVAGLSCTLVYKSLKHATARPRPCDAGFTNHLTVQPLDTFSFPSGHTLHAICFTMIATAAVPWLGLILWPFTIMVALSRLVLGLHYPSDVLAGASIGAAIAYLTISLTTMLRCWHETPRRRRGDYL